VSIRYGFAARYCVCQLRESIEDMPIGQADWRRPVAKEKNNIEVADFRKLSNRAVLKYDGDDSYKTNSKIIHCVQSYCSSCCCLIVLLLKFCVFPFKSVLIICFAARERKSCTRALSNVPAGATIYSQNLVCFNTVA